MNQINPKTEEKKESEPEDEMPEKKRKVFEINEPYVPINPDVTPIKKYYTPGKMLPPVTPRGKEREKEVRGKKGLW